MAHVTHDVARWPLCCACPTHMAVRGLARLSHTLCEPVGVRPDERPECERPECERPEWWTSCKRLGGGSPLDCCPCKNPIRRNLIDPLDAC